MNRLRTLYTHSRDVLVEVGKNSVKYNIPIYNDSITGKLLNVHKNHSYLVIEMERIEVPEKPREIALPEEPIKLG